MPWDQTGPPRQSVRREGKNENLSPRVIRHLETEKMRPASNGENQESGVPEVKKGLRTEVVSNSHVNYVQFCGSSSKRDRGLKNVDVGGCKHGPPVPCSGSPREVASTAPGIWGWLCELHWPAGLWQMRCKHRLARSCALGSSSLLLSGTLSPSREWACGRWNPCGR